MMHPCCKGWALEQSCSGGQKPSQGNTCLDTDSFLFIGSVIRWLLDPHYPKMKLKYLGQARPSVWLPWSQNVHNSNRGPCQPVPAKNDPKTYNQLSNVNLEPFKFYSQTKKQASGKLLPENNFACCLFFFFFKVKSVFWTQKLLLCSDSANHNAQCRQMWYIINRFVKGLHSWHFLKSKMRPPGLPFQ